MLTGGGSGGHVYPLVAVAEEMQAQAVQKGMVLELTFLGDDGFFKEIGGPLGIKAVSILSPKWRRYSSIENVVDALKLPVGFLQALFHVWRYMPDLIFSKGGYDSFMPVFAARIFMIPIIIHESDIIPGKANVWAGKWAKKVFLSFEAAAKYFKRGITEVVGNPLRRGIMNGPDRSVALAALSLDPAKPAVLITGASQGAKIINDTLLLALVELTKKFQVIHQSGPKNYDEVNKRILQIIKEGQTSYGPTIQSNYRLYPVLNLAQMATAYAAADVVVSRAGAGSLFEIAAIAKPAVIIPLKGSASDHQLANAREFAKFGATVIEEDNLSPHILVNEIEGAYSKRQELSVKIKVFAKPAAAQIIATQLLAMATA